jgi:hypothetical protein
MTTSDDELAALVQKFETDGWSSDIFFRNRAIQADNFYNGDQWESGTLQTRTDKKLPTFTFNIIKNTVEFLVGTQERNRKDISVVPVKNATNSIASIQTKLVKDTIAKNNGEHLFSEWFRQGCVKGRAFVHLYVDYEKDPLTGDLFIENVDALDCIIDPLTKRYDLSDSKYLIIHKYMNRDEVLALYPERHNELINIAMTDNTLDKDGTPDLVGTSTGGKALTSEESRYVNITQYRYKVQWTYIKQYEKRTHLINTDEMTDRIINVSNPREKMKDLLTQHPETYSVVDRVDSVLYLVKSINGLIIERIKEPFKKDDGNDIHYLNPMNMIPVSPFGAHFDNGRWEGIVDDLIDPQQEKNKLRSNIVQIMGATANGGYAVKVNSLSPDEENKLRISGGEPGQIIHYTDEAPTKFGANPVPLDILALSNQSDTDINAISGVNVSNLGGTIANESGTLNAQRQIQGITTNTGVFDNFDYSMKILGNIITGIIRSTELYTLSEVEEIVEDYDMFDNHTMAKAEKESSEAIARKMNLEVFPSLRDFIKSAEATDSSQSQEEIEQDYQVLLQQKQQYTLFLAKQIVMNELGNLYKGRYGITIALSNYSPTVKDSNLQTMLEISRIAPGYIGPEELIQESNLHNKDQIIRKAQQRQQAAQEAQSNAIKAELQGKMMLQKMKNEGEIEQERVKGRNKLVTDTANNATNTTNN